MLAPSMLAAPALRALSLRTSMLDAQHFASSRYTTVLNARISRPHPSHHRARPPTLRALTLRTSVLDAPSTRALALRTTVLDAPHFAPSPFAPPCSIPRASPSPFAPPCSTPRASRPHPSHHLRARCPALHALSLRATSTLDAPALRALALRATSVLDTPHFALSPFAPPCSTPSTSHPFPFAPPPCSKPALRALSLRATSALDAPTLRALALRTSVLDTQHFAPFRSHHLRAPRPALRALWRYTSVLHTPALRAPVLRAYASVLRTSALSASCCAPPCLAPSLCATFFARPLLSVGRFAGGTSCAMRARRRSSLTLPQLAGRMAGGSLAS